MNYKIVPNGDLYVNGVAIHYNMKSETLISIVRHLEAVILSHEMVKGSQISMLRDEMESARAKVIELEGHLTDRNHEISLLKGGELEMEEKLKDALAVNHRLKAEILELLDFKHSQNTPHNDNVKFWIESFKRESQKALEIGAELEKIKKWQEAVNPLLDELASSSDIIESHKNQIIELCDINLELQIQLQKHKKLEENFTKVSDLNEAHKNACMQWEKLMNNLVHEDGPKDVEKAILALKSALFTAVDIYHMRAAGRHDGAYVDEMKFVKELKNLKEEGWLKEILMPETIYLADTRFSPEPTNEPSELVSGFVTFSVEDLKRIRVMAEARAIDVGITYLAKFAEGIVNDAVSIGIWKRKQNRAETEQEMDYLEKAMRNDELLANNGMKG